ncbi:MAG: hypothetical protein ABIH08_02035 [Candidatus Omnitrophota bacterium]
MRDNKRKVILFLGVFFSFVLVFCLSLQECFSYEGRDPFSPLVSKGGMILIAEEMEISGLALDGIIYSQGESLTVINNEILKEGDSLGEYRVIKIKEREVILRTDKEEFILKLEEE